MTENKAISILKQLDKYEDEVDFEYEDAVEAVKIATKALEELQMYKQGGLCLIPADAYKKQCEELDAYKEIGTVEDIQEVISFIDLDDEHGIIDDLELLNKYRLLGTSEELQELKEKNVAKKPLDGGEVLREVCPTCGRFISEMNSPYYCPCGQKLDWK